MPVALILSDLKIQNLYVEPAGAGYRVVVAYNLVDSTLARSFPQTRVYFSSLAPDEPKLPALLEGQFNSLLAAVDTALSQVEGL